jgi:hypothetical protein
MKAKSRMVVAAAILFAVSAAPANAQQRMVSVTTRSTAVRVRPAGAHAAATRMPAARRAVAPAPRAAVHFNAATNSFESADGSFVSLQDLLNPVPGLGFDYHHLSVINQDLGVKAFIDPVTELKLAAARRFLRGSGLRGSGFFLLDGGAYYPLPTDDSASAEQAPADQPAQPQQPQMIVVEAPTGQQAADHSPDATGEEAPLPDVGQFTLVLQNGKQLQAVAFTRMNDQIVYITVDGNRRTIAAADLNSDATVRINEERGTPLQLPL